MGSRRSQYATEYLSVVALSAILLISIVMILMSHYSNVRYSMTMQQTYSAANQLKGAVMNVYYLGEGSMTTVYITIPEGIKYSSLENNEILFRMGASGGLDTDIFVSSDIGLDGSIPNSPGTYQLKVISTGARVCIDKEGGPSCPGV